MSHLTLRTKDLTFERSKVRSGGVHNFEGFTRSPTAADKALLYKVPSSGILRKVYINSTI